MHIEREDRTGDDPRADHRCALDIPVVGELVPSAGLHDYDERDPLARASDMKLLNGRAKDPGGVIQVGEDDRIARLQVVRDEVLSDLLQGAVSQPRLGTLS